MFASLVAVESVMSALAVLAPNYTIGMIVGAGYLGLFILTCGYFALPQQLPAPVWKYPMYYVSVYAYLFQGFLLNEFQVGLEKRVCALDLSLRSRFGSGLGPLSEAV